MSQAESPVKPEEVEQPEPQSEESPIKANKSAVKQQEREPSPQPEISKSRKQETVQQQKLQSSVVSVPKSIAKQDLWKPYDFLFPGGKLAKLIKVNNVYKKNIPYRDMLDKFKIVEMTPVINIIGAMDKGRGKFYAGIARAAFNTDAVIVDNGLASGLEKFTLRRGVKLIGIAPEGEIKFPKINPSQVDGTELANGHTHLFLVNNPDKDLKWGGETQMKIDLCIKIAEGKKRAQGVNRCKIVSILMADAIFDVIEEVKLCMENEIPIIVVPGSSVSDALIKLSSGDDDGSVPGQLRQLNIESGHFFYCNSTNSEDIAQLTHLLLSITPW